MIKKQTYHSNTHYKVCAKIIANSEQLQNEFIKIQENFIELQDPSGEFQDKYSFSLNKIFTKQKNQETQDYLNENIFQRMNDKQNACIISFGPKQSGKSKIILQGTTIFGNKDISGSNYENSVAFATINYLLQHKDNKTKIYVGLLDICLNNLVDIGKVYHQKINGEQMSLNFENSNVDLIQEYDKYILSGLQRFEINTPDELKNLIETCFQFKKNLDNQSHFYFDNNHTILMFQAIQHEQMVEKVGVSIQLVELASFRQIAKVNQLGQSMKNNIIIKNSLLTLQQCLQAIAQSNQGYAQYKDSLLTKVLKPCLDIDSIICILSHVHIYEGFNYEDQLNSLFFTDNTRKLINIHKVKEKEIKKTKQVLFKNYQFLCLINNQNRQQDQCLIKKQLKINQKWKQLFQIEIYNKKNKNWKFKIKFQFYLANQKQL